MGSHPRIINPSLSLQLTPTTWGRKKGSPGRYRPARCGNANPTGWFLIGWGSWSQRATRVAPRANDEVPPHPGRISAYPRIRNLPISLQHQQTGQENADPPGRYRSAQRGNPNPIGWLLIGWGSCSQRAARVAPRNNVEVPSHPRKIGSHSRGRNTSISLRLQQPGTKTGIPRVDATPHGVETPTPLVGC